MVVDAAMMADRHRQAVEKSHATGLTQTRLPVGRQRKQHGGQARDQTLITDQSGKLGLPVTADLLAIEMFESALIRIVKGDHQPPDLAPAQRTRAATMPTGGGPQTSLPSRSKRLLKVIEVAIKGYHIHGRAPEQEGFRPP